MSPPDPQPPSGRSVWRRPDAKPYAANARDRLVAKRLEADGINPADLTFEELAAYRQRVLAEGAARARAAKAMKHAVKVAEREALAEAWEAQRAAKKAEAEAKRAARAARDGTP